MEDRFRFRAWNKRENKMIYNAEDVYDGSLSGWCGNENNNNDGWISCFGEYLGRDDEYVVMQSTGLKDKNDKLIYEGDIIIINHTTPFGTEIKQVCRVEFSDGCFWARTKTEAVILYHEDNEYKIIGNIYENKELLEGK